VVIRSLKIRPGVVAASPPSDDYPKRMLRPGLAPWRAGRGLPSGGPDSTVHRGRRWDAALTVVYRVVRLNAEPAVVVTLPSAGHAVFASVHVESLAPIAMIDVVDMVPEEPDCEQDRKRSLEVQEQGRRQGREPVQTDEKQHGPDHGAREHDPEQRRYVRARESALPFSARVTEDCRTIFASGRLTPKRVAAARP